MKDIFQLFKISILLFLISCGQIPESAIESNENARIFPDYTDIHIPYNIAPLNFRIDNQYDNYVIHIYSEKGTPILLKSDNGKVIIPIKKWHNLLDLNREKQLAIDIYFADSLGKWKKFKQITNKILSTPIDPYLSYRLLPPGFQFWDELGIYQRNLEDFSEYPILSNNLIDNGCVNCHTYCNQNPDLMVMQLRVNPTGMLISKNSEIEVVNTKTPFNGSVATYTSWHPGGEIITSSVNKISQRFHNTGEQIREVFDGASDLICYDIARNEVFTDPMISSLERRETFPNWSADGKYLYFSSSPRNENPLDLEDHVKYDIMRISYDADNRKWGKLDTLLKASELEKSMVICKPSPDGNFVVFTATHHGSFPIYMKDADLYILNLNDLTYKRLKCNSEETESYHSWSSESKWMVFSSKRYNQHCARPFFTFIDENGNSTKPFVMPQKDPDFYDTYIMTYNVPELMKGKVNVRPNQLARATKSIKQAKLAPYVKVDSRSGATQLK
jgi:hypothetical protein